MYSLYNKVAIITGAGGKRGLGRTIALRLASDGVDIAIVDKYLVAPQSTVSVDQWQGMDSVVKEIKAMGRRALSIACDISNAQAVDHMVREVIIKFGKIDILVNNAGIHNYATVLNMSDEIWNKHLTTNLTGTFYCSRAVAREMVQRGTEGRIINIASALGKVGAGNGQSAYCASKFGVIGFTQCLALELAVHKILVNAVCPALLDTDLHENAFSEKAKVKGIAAEDIRRKMNEEFIDKVPLGRLGTPDDVASLVAFLCSEESSFITGESINVNGGFFTAL